MSCSNDRKGLTYNVPEDVHAGHDTDKQDLLLYQRRSAIRRETGMHNETPTKYRRAILSATNQNITINPDIPRIRSQVLQ